MPKRQLDDSGDIPITPTSTTFADGHDDWWRQVFSDVEYDEIQQTTRDIQRDFDQQGSTDDEMQLIPLLVSKEIFVPVMEGLRILVENDSTNDTLKEFLTAIGCALGVHYLITDEMEMDDSLSSLAGFFGSRQWTEDDMEEMEDDEDDDDDDE